MCHRIQSAAAVLLFAVMVRTHTCMAAAHAKGDAASLEHAMETKALPVECTVELDAGNITHAIPEAMNGCHYSPLDHQLFYVYSQMVYDESFEQSISDKKGGLHKEGPGDTVSLGWTNISTVGLAVGRGGMARWVNDSALAFNGNVSVELTLPSSPGVSTTGAPARVGVAARGLYHQGYHLEAGRDYHGYLAVKAAKPGTLYVGLEDWGSDPSGGPAHAAPLATTVLHHAGGGEWALLNYTLRPSRATRCTPFPFGSSPLDCSVPDSQRHAPDAATGTCVVCGGTLAVWVQDAGATVSIDQVFMEPGEWGRYKGLHMHLAAAQWLLSMGTRMVRYGGTFTETVQGKWEYDRGPAWQRPPCTAGKAVGGHGGCHMTKLARWTRGYGVIEVINFCEAAGLECIVGFGNQETPEAMAAFVEYAYGDSSTHWGALRIADGHPQTYPAVSIEISNENCMSSFTQNTSFAIKIAAMEAAARVHGMGGKLRYITGSYLGIVSASNKCAGSPNTTTTLFQQVKAVGLCSQLQLDTHVTPNTQGNPGTVIMAEQLQTMAEAAGCGEARLVVLEQNKCGNHFDRALRNAGAAAGLQSIPTLAATATSQCWTAGAHADGCGEGHIVAMPGLVFGAAPFYASQMIYTSYLPRALAVNATPIAPKSASSTSNNLTVFAAASQTGDRAVLRIVNDNNISVRVSLRLHPSAAQPWSTHPSAAAVTTLASPLAGTAQYALRKGGWNAPGNLTYISPQSSTWSMAGGAVYEVPPESFVIMEFNSTMV